MIVVAVLGVLVAAASLAAFAGRWVWWLDLLANFRAQYVVVLTLLGLLVAASRWRRTGFAVLGVALLNLLLVAPLYVVSPPRPTPGAPTVEVLSFNLLSDNRSYNEVVEYLGAVDADLVLLHEASRPWEVALESADLPYQVIRGRSEDLIFGTLVLVPGPVEAVSYGFAADEPRAISLTYTPEGWPRPIEVLSVHPLAPSTSERARLRDAQLAFAADWARERTGPYLVAGDLNASPWSWGFRRLLQGTGLRNSQLGYGLHASFPARSTVLLRVPIDHLLHSEELAVRDRRLGPALGSDHFPLRVELEYVGPGGG